MRPEPGATDSVNVSFRTLGCKVNRVESDAIAADLIGRGVTITDEDAAAVVVINTCTVTGEADAKARKAVRHALGAARSPVVVVTGCLAAVDATALRALGDRVVVEADKDLVPSRVSELLGSAVPANHGAGMREAAARSVSRDGFRTRAMLKIEDGCDNFCTYCIVPYARGVPRAVPRARVIADAEALAAAGVREIVLTGINLGRYDDGGCDLAQLVHSVAATGIDRVRLSSIEPPDLTPALLATLSQTPAVCEHLHVPLQSGSDRVLAAMGRKYTAAEYESFIAAARQTISGLAVTTDVIAGFPGETERDHEATMALIERVGFAKLHVFRYSRRTGTPAADREQLAPETISARAAQLRRSGEALRSAYVARRLGSVSQVLVETVDGTTAAGTTRDYLRVDVHCPGVSVGDLVSVRLDGGSSERVTARCAGEPPEGR